MASSDSLAATASPVPRRALWRKFHLRTPGDFGVSRMESTVPAVAKRVGMCLSGRSFCGRSFCGRSFCGRSFCGSSRPSAEGSPPDWPNPRGSCFPCERALFSWDRTTLSAPVTTAVGFEPAEGWVDRVHFWGSPVVSARGAASSRGVRTGQTASAVARATGSRRTRWHGPGEPLVQSRTGRSGTWPAVIVSPERPARVTTRRPSPSEIPRRAALRSGE